MRSKIPLLIVVIALLILGLIVFLGLVGRYRQLAASLPTVLENELEARLDRKVKIETARLVSPNVLVATNLAIADGATFKEGTLFRARRVVIVFKTFNILLGRTTLAQSISLVTLVDPSARLTRDSRGIWNIEDLLRGRPVPATRRFRGLVRISGGKLTVIDRAAELVRLPAVNTLTAVSGYLDFAPARSFLVDLGGEGQQARVRSVRAVGRWGILAPTTNLKVIVRNADAGYWFDYFSYIPSWNISRGRFDADAVLSQPEGQAIIARGDAKLYNSTVTSRYLAIPVQPFAANIRFIGTNLSVAGRGYIRRSPILLQGRVMGLSPARLDLRIESERADVNTLQAAIRPFPRLPRVRWPRPATIVAGVTGTTPDIRVAALARIPMAVIYGTPVRALELRGTYRDGIIRIADAVANTAGGRITSTAAIDVQRARIRVSGTALGARLALLPLPRNLQASGVADVRFAVDYLRGLRSARLIVGVSQGRMAGVGFARGQARVIFAGPRVADATVSLFNGTAPGMVFENATADLGLRGRQILAREILVDAFRGTIAASGTATIDGRLNLEVATNNIQLQALLSPLGYRDLTGIADFRGTLTGTLDSPSLSGFVEARDGRLRQVEYDLLVGRLIATPERLVLENAIIRRQQAEIVSIGRVTIARRAPPRIELQVRARRIDLQQLFSLLGIPARAEGIARGDLQIRGQFPNIQVSGDMEVADAVVANIPVDRALVSFQSREGRTVITDLFARRGDMQVIGSGSVGPGGEISIDLIGENLRLSLLNERLHPYVLLQGPMTFSGEVRGTIRRPTVRGSISSAAPVVNGQQFESLAAELTWDGARLSIGNGVLTDQRTMWRLPLVRFNPATTFLEFSGSVSSGSIARIVEMLHNSPVATMPQGEALRRFLALSPTPFSGAIDASLVLAGPLGNLSGSADIDVDGVQLGDAIVTHAELVLSARGSRFFLQRASISSPGVRLAASANFLEAEPTSISADITDTQISVLLDLLQSATFLRLYGFGRQLLDFAERVPTPASGILNASLSMVDVQTSPTGQLSANTTDLTIGGSEIGDITTTARLSNGTVTVEEFLLEVSGGRFTVQGTANMDGVISLSGMGTDLPLSVLQPFLGRQILSGAVDFGFTATGPISNPAIQASFTATDVRTPKTAFDLITTDRIVIAGGRISTDGLEVQIEDMRALFTGYIPFVWATPFIPPDQPLLVQAQLTDQDLSLLESLSEVEEARGALTANVQVSGTLNEPKMDGEVSLRDGSLSLRGFENDFTNITLDATFDDSSLRVETLSGVSSLGGTFSGGGTVEFTALTQAQMGLFLTVDSLRLNAVNVTHTVGERLLMTTTGQLTITGDLRAPSIQGPLVVRDARIVIPPDVVLTAVQIPAFPVDVQLAVTLNLAREVVVERGALRSEIVGPVTIGGSLSRPIIEGTVQVVEGSLRYPTRTLEISRGGTASFLIEPPRPAVITVDVSARTRVTTLSPITGRITRYTVILDISGPIGELNIAVRSSPPGLSGVEAIALVFGGVALEALVRGEAPEEVLQEQIGQVLLGVSLPELFQPFEIGGIVFGFEPGLDVPLQITASTALTGRVILSYSRSVIGRLPVDTFSLSYTLSPQLAVTTMFEGQAGAPRETTYLIEYFRRY